MIILSMRATMAVHLPISTLIIISLPQDKPSTQTLHPPPPTLATLFFWKGYDFLLLSVFIPSLLYPPLLSDPDVPTAAYANGAAFRRHKYQLKRAASPHIHLEIVRVRCLIKMRVNLIL